MSFLKSWNFHPLEKGHCNCKQMAGNTFVTISTEEGGLPNSAFVLQIDEDSNFSISLHGGLTIPLSASTVALGKWKCCENKWVGVAIAIYQSINPQTIYRRISIEVDTDTLVARIRSVYTDVPFGECVSSYTSENAIIGLIETVQLQPLGQNCGIDFDLETTIIPA